MAFFAKIPNYVDISTKYDIFYGMNQNCGITIPKPHVNSNSLSHIIEETLQLYIKTLFQGIGMSTGHLSK